MKGMEKKEEEKGEGQNCYIEEGKRGDGKGEGGRR